MYVKAPFGEVLVLWSAANTEPEDGMATCQALAKKVFQQCPRCVS